MQLPLIKIGHSLKLIALIMVLSFLNSCNKFDLFPHHDNNNKPEESADVLYDWYKLGARMQLYTIPGPAVPTNNRAFGYIGVGVYEAVQPGIKGSKSLTSALYQMAPMPTPEAHKDYLWGASANAALASMFRQFLAGLTDANKASIDSLENAYNNRYKLSTSDAVISRSQAFGRAVATAIYNWSTTDNFSLSATGYVLPVFPGSWVPTPPAFAPPVGPFLKDSRPFLQSSLNWEIPPLPFVYSEHPSSEFYKANKEVYDIGRALTAEQKAIANFWADVGGVGLGFPGPHHIISIITDVLKGQKAKLGQAAQIYARTGIAFKESFYIIWKIKFHHNLLRPVTYINKLINAEWQSYLPTPPYPDFPSGLSGVYTSNMQILIREFGNIPVTDATYAVPRHYPSLSALIEEAAISRLYAGIHYRVTQNVTIVIGKQLGNRIADIKLGP